MISIDPNINLTIYQMNPNTDLPDFYSTESGLKGVVNFYSILTLICVGI